jgi:hypothetical protein
MQRNVTLAAFGFDLPDWRPGGLISIDRRHPSDRTPRGRPDTVINFVVRFTCVEIHPSARRHGVDDDDILHAVANSLVIDDLGEDPDRWLVIGPDRAGNLLEIVVLIAGTAAEIIIHAMPMRPKYRKLLEQ